MRSPGQKYLRILIPIILIPMVSMLLFSGRILTFVGEFLVMNETPVRSDAVVVLNTGMEYYPRLVEAAALYRQGFVAKLVINGNRKTETLRELEKMGLKYCCPWYEERIRILELLDVPRKDIVTISAEDVYDTISEAKAVGRGLIANNLSKIIITTSKSHTRRARYIWKTAWPEQFRILAVAAGSDPYAPAGWWREGRQIKWVLSEYGAWLFMHWNHLWGGEKESAG